MDNMTPEEEKMKQQLQQQELIRKQFETVQHHEKGILLNDPVQNR